MRAVGLIPSHTGEPGGKSTGQRMTHYIDPSGPFAAAAMALMSASFALRWQATADQGSAVAAKKNKIKYTCETCGQNAWAKPETRLICGDCEQPMIPKE